MSGAAFWRGENGTSASEIEDLSADLDQVFALFSHPRRRALLYLLRDADAEPVWTTNLAVELARMEADAGEDLHDRAEEIALSLRHNHLPKLADSGVVDVDSSMTTLTYRGDARVDDLLRWSRQREGASEQFRSE